MLTPRVNTKQTARSVTVPAPVGGLNGRDGLADMPPKDAYVLDNWVPGTATLDARGGCSLHEAAFGGAVETIVPYIGGASRKLLAFAAGKIFDATLPTTIVYQNDGTDTTGFALSANAGISSVAGRLRVTNALGGAGPNVQLTFNTVPGTNYTLALDIVGASFGPANVALVTNEGGVSFQSVGAYITLVFTAAGATSSFSLQVNSSTQGAWVDFDNIIIATVLPAALQTGRTGNNIVSTMFSNAGNQFLIGVSGLDVAFSYDGAAVANLAITGITGSAANLSHVFAYKGRLYFCQKDQLGFYYLAVGAIQGAASYFDLSQVARNGGYLVATASFSADSGNGPADYFVCITSTGEYIVYAGTDPANAANWALVGRYYAAPPIGRKCTLNYGAELVILTTGGALPFSAIRREGGIADTDAVTYKLGNLLIAQTANAGVQGWQALLYNRKGLAVFNVPITSSAAGSYVQFVQNTITKAWTRFTGLNALCWTEFNGDLYFGTYTGVIMHFDTQQSDNGKAIQLECKQAWNAFEDGSGTGNVDKHFHFAKMLLASDGNPPLNAQFNTDFDEVQPEAIETNLSPSGGSWDTATWDLAEWGADVTTQFVIISVGKLGVAGSLWLRASLLGLTLKWYATKYIFSKAQGVL